MVGPLGIVCAGPNFIVGVGVASVALPPQSFPPLDLLETANRCLSAAQSGEAFGVKSLEIYWGLSPRLAYPFWPSPLDSRPLTLNAPTVV